jgi:hypothetical protein
LVTVDNTAPIAPTPISPTDGSSIGDAVAGFAPEFDQTWTSVSDAVLYGYQSCNVDPGDAGGVCSSVRWIQDFTGTLKHVDAGQPNGQFWWRLRAKDEAGNWSGYGEAFKFTIDNTAPTAPEIVFPNPDQYFTTQPILNDWTNVVDGLSGLDYYRIEYVYDDGHTFSGGPYRIVGLPNNPADSPASQRNHIPAIGEQGGVSFRVQAFDNAGNEGAWSEWRHYYYDASDPWTVFTAPSDGQIFTGPIHIAGISEDNPDFGGIVGMVGLFYSVSGENDWQTLATIFNPAGDEPFSWGTDWTPLVDGAFDLKATATDRAGNVEGTAYVFEIVYDINDPVVEITSPTDPLLNGTVAIRGSVNDANPWRYWLVIQDSSNSTVAGPGTVYDSTSFTDEFFFDWDTTTVPDGTYTIKLEARDLANNKSGNPGVSYDWMTVTVDNIAPTLRLVKLVTNDNGGGALPGDWTLFAIAGEDESVIDSGDSDEFHDVIAGTMYTLSESDTPSGYSASGWSCDGGSLEGDELVLGLDDNVTCTITNDDQPGTLIVQKIVVNYDGGAANGSDFYFQVNGGEPGPFLSDEELKEITVDQGTYTVTEEPAEGYETSYDNCEEVFIPNGGSETCIVTNDDIAPTLHLVKTVNNDNGGNAVPGDWTLFAIAGEDESVIDSGDSTQFHPAIAGITYTLSESDDDDTPSGYLASGWSCDGGSLEGENGDELVLGLAENVTCTITNDDVAPSLTLNKVVTNDNGGTETESAWTLTASGPTGFSGAGPSVSNGESFDAGTYNLSESGPSGYTAGAWVCEGGTQGSSGDTVTLGLGESATCTITNDDIAPQLTVIKHMINNSTGTSVAGDFTMFVSGLNVSSSVFPGSESGTTVTLDAGEYLVSELAVSGYTMSLSADCDGTIGVGETKTCTVTNNDQDVLAAETESDGEVLGAEVLPDTGIPIINLLFAVLAFEVGLYLRRRSRLG